MGDDQDDPPYVHYGIDPSDPPEKQILEQQADRDMVLEQETHRAIAEEQRVADRAREAKLLDVEREAEQRVKVLEKSEQEESARIVKDTQAIQHYDHDHPAPVHAAAAPAEDSDASGSADTFGDSYADAATGDEDGATFDS